MKRRLWGSLLVGAVLVGAPVLAGSSASAAPHPHRLTGDDAAHATAAEKVARTPHGTAAGTTAGTSATTAIVPMPDLAITHRLPGGGMNLWRLPLSEFDPNYGTPQLVKKLDYGGFSYDHSVTLAGDVADVTPSDDGTADYIIWHAQPNGGVLVWAVGGGGDTTPQLWADLRTGGWSYANSTPMLGDVNGDGWDDLVVRHRLGATGANMWVFLSDGRKFGAPQLWFQELSSRTPFDQSRNLLADMNADGLDDWVYSQEEAWQGTYNGLHMYARLSSGTSFLPGGATPEEPVYNLFFGVEAWAGWSFANSRMLAGDVSGEGRDDLVTVHLQPGGGILVWVHEHCFQAGVCIQDPQVWQDLRTGGWSFAGSRQYLADTDGDAALDLISVHSQGSNPGLLVWRHVSDSWTSVTDVDNSFSPPQIVANLKTGGWSYLNSRETVADLYGQITY